MNAMQEDKLQFIKTFLEEDLKSEDLELVKERFKITDLNGLTWVFDQYKTLTTKESEIKQVAESQRNQIDYWEQKELSSVNQSLEFFHNLISEYHASVLAENPKAKTLSTPYGKAKARITKEQPKKVDEHLILDHVISANLDEYIKQEVKWGDFKKSLRIVEIGQTKVAVNENGEIVPGVEIEPESIKFSMEIL